jgi:hypothetical protein
VINPEEYFLKEALISLERRRRLLFIDRWSKLTSLEERFLKQPNQRIHRHQRGSC